MSHVQKISFTTADGIRIVGNYLPADGEKFALLLHMMPATKESWDPFIELLSESGYDCLAIDLRGHGESTMDGALDYKQFSDAQQQAKIKDVRAAFAWLQEKGSSEENTIVIGASIGANLAIQFLSEHEQMQKAVALSPGIDYHGVVTDVLVEQLEEEQQVLLMASSEDTYASESIEELHELNPDQTTILPQSGLGHGTTMFVKKPALMDEVIEWLG